MANFDHLDCFAIDLMALNDKIVHP